MNQVRRASKQRVFMALTLCLPRANLPYATLFWGALVV